MPQDDDNKKDRPSVQSLARAFGILERIAQAKTGISLTDLGKAVGLHNSTAFHLVRTMVQLGYVRQDEATKKYHLGRPLFLLAASVLNDVELSNIAGPVLEELARQTGETSHFAVRSGDTIAIMARSEGTSPFRLSEDAGTVRPPHATAVGKVLMAYREPGQLARFLERAVLSAHTPATITDRDRLAAELATVRETGLAFDDTEFFTEVRCAAVPVFDFRSQVIGALGISGPVWRLSLSALQSKVPLLQQAAARFSAELGHPGSSAEPAGEPTAEPARRARA